MGHPSWAENAALIAFFVFGGRGLLIGLVAIALAVLWVWHPVPVDKTPATETKSDKKVESSK